jgi:hypothetical protein
MGKERNGSIIVWRWASLRDCHSGVGKEGVLASLEHARGKFSHDRLCLDC